MREIYLEHINYSRQIFSLARVDLVKHYRGSFFGALWAFVQPSLQILVFWLMIHVGLRASNSDSGGAFFVWLTVGMVPWFFMTDMIGRAMDSFKNYKYLITKVKFPISVIPTFVGVSNLITHAGLLALTLVILLLTGTPLSWTLLQLPLYTVLMFCFFQAWALLTAPLALLSKDFSLGVKSVTRMLMFVSGIMYDVESMTSGWFKELMSFNPIYFFVQGYRNSLLEHRWIWDTPPHQLLIFAVELALVAGAAVFMLKHTRKHLGDVA
ncbi:ABC transporter permease [Micrococcales bacterium 31B]|nr:ABC transporter permease [Micrococcales bacterium 31B]